MKKIRVAAVAAACLFAAPVFALAGCADTDETVVLRVSNWEEYIDLGDWGDDRNNRRGKPLYGRRLYNGREQRD